MLVDAVPFSASTASIVPLVTCVAVAMPSLTTAGEPPKSPEQTGGVWVAPWRLADDYHVYGLDWNKDELVYYVDGVAVWKVPLPSLDPPSLPVVAAVQGKLAASAE